MTLTSRSPGVDTVGSFEEVAGREWRGHWIWSSRRATEPLVTDTFVRDEAGPTTRTLFRRTFSLDALPTAVPARLSADSRYVLWVNGGEVARGPARSQPRRMRYDTVDLAPYLVSGDNTIAAVVTYFATPNAYWAAAATNATLGGHGVFVFEARLPDGWLASDEQWLTCQTEAWSATDHEDTLAGSVPTELFDARLLAADWAQTGFDASAWLPANVLVSAHIGGSGRTQPPTDPYGPLLPRIGARPDGETITPASARWAGVTDIPDADLPPTVRVVEALRSGGMSHTEAVSLPARPDPQVGRSALMELDFGRIVSGLVTFEVTAAPGTQIDLLYLESRYTPEMDTMALHNGARYIARGSNDRYVSLHPNGLRYLYLLVESASTVSIDSIAVREQVYPWSGKAFFRSSDERVNALYRAGIRTVELNSYDAFIDCPTREQRSWVGDGVVHELVHLATNEDWRLALNYLELGDSPRADGILPMSVGGDLEHGGGLTIPDWSLYWVHGIHEYFRHSGDIADVERFLPTIERILRWYVPYLDGDGVLADVPEWTLVDWSSLILEGQSSIQTALWAQALLEYVALSAAAGNHGAARWARGLWEAARVGFEVFWDDARGSYVDSRSAGIQNPAMSQVAGAFAILSGLAPRERWDRIISRITDPDRLVVRSWIGGQDGNYDQNLMRAQMFGPLAPDWDTTEQTVLGEPFVSHLVHDAIARAGFASILPRLHERWHEFLTDGYDTFGECWGWGTRVHGWSSSPARELVTYVLGITPEEPGFAVARVQPQLGSLDWMEGAAPTPHGLINVRVSGDECVIDSPVDVLFVHPDGWEAPLPPGHHRIQLA